MTERGMQTTVSTVEQNHFVTVVDHRTHENGVIDLVPLDEGPEEDPKFLRVFPDDGPIEPHGYEESDA